ncbi:hypothetical protein PYCC9005_004535 [Savitreella phatthalungensis]
MATADAGERLRAFQQRQRGITIATTTSTTTRESHESSSAQHSPPVSPMSAGFVSQGRNRSTRPKAPSATGTTTPRKPTSSTPLTPPYTPESPGLYTFSTQHVSSISPLLRQVPWGSSEESEDDSDDNSDKSNFTLPSHSRRRQAIDAGVLHKLNVGALNKAPADDHKDAGILQPPNQTTAGHPISSSSSHYRTTSLDATALVSAASFVSIPRRAASKPPANRLAQQRQPQQDSGRGSDSAPVSPVVRQVEGFSDANANNRRVSLETSTALMQISGQSNENDKLRIDGVIGRGAQAVVHRGVYKGARCAVKRASTPAAERSLRRELLATRVICARAAAQSLPSRSPVPEVLADALVGNRLALVKPLAMCDLWTLIRDPVAALAQQHDDFRQKPSFASSSTSLTSLDPKQVLNLSRKAAHAVASLHALRVVHTDIKPQNMLLYPSPHKADALVTSPEELTVQLTDLEEAYIPGCNDQSPLPRNLARGNEDVVGSSGYTAPEILAELSSSSPLRRLNTPEVDESTDGGFSADVYALACSLLALATAEEPLSAARSMVERTVWAARGNPLAFITSEAQAHLHSLPPAFQQALTSALVADPAARPTAQQLAAALDAIIMS